MKLLHLKISQKYVQLNLHYENIFTIIIKLKTLKSSPCENNSPNEIWFRKAFVKRSDFFHQTPTKTISQARTQMNPIWLRLAMKCFAALDYKPNSIHMLTMKKLKCFAHSSSCTFRISMAVHGFSGPKEIYEKFWLKFFLHSSSFRFKRTA